MLASLARRVYSVERIPALAETAERALRELGITWKSHRRRLSGLGRAGTLDAIIVTAAAAGYRRRWCKLSRVAGWRFRGPQKYESGSARDLQG